MITINLAFDEEIAAELFDYLAEQKIDCNLKDAEILVNQKINEKVLAVFLEKTKRDKHVIQKIDADTYLISKMGNPEDLGLGTCEICGLVATKDKLYSHRWTHGA